MRIGTKTCAILAAVALNLMAQEGESRWRFSGFGTLGLAANSTDSAEFVRDPTQPRGTVRSLDPRLDSRLGVQLNLNLTEELSLVGQLVSKYRFDHTYTPEVSWAFLSYAPTSGIQARVGRLGWDVFQLADSRNVGYSYLWARPPVDFYGPLLISSLDGGDLAWTTSIGEGRNLRFKVSAGRASNNNQVPTGGNGLYVKLGGAKLSGLLAEFQGGSVTLRAAYAQLQPIRNFPPPVTDLQDGLNAFGLLLNDPGLTQQAKVLNFAENLFRYTSIGLEWHKGAFRVESVGAQVRSGAGPIADLKSGYLSLGYRTGTVVPYVLVSRIVSDNPEPYVGALLGMGPQAAALVDGIHTFLFAQRADQSTLSLGCRWDLHPKAALKAQVDRVSADPRLSMLWPGVRPGWDGKATVASVVLDFVF